MAKNISLLGADYPDVPAVQLPQTGGGTATFYDIQVIDNLNSSSGTDALSANQGRLLNNAMSGKANVQRSGWEKTMTVTGAKRAILQVGLSLFVVMITGSTPTINLARMGDYSNSQFGASVTANYSSTKTVTIEATSSSSFTVTTTDDTYMMALY